MAINTTSNDAPSKALQMLKRIRKLDGTALISGGVLLHDECPRGTDTKQFSQAVVQMFEGLEANNEYVDDLLLRFDGGDVLLMYRCPVILCLFFDRDRDLVSIEKGGNQFLSQFSSALGVLSERPNKKTSVTTELAVQGGEPAVEEVEEVNDEEAWEEFRKNVEILFTKVLGSAQANRFLTRELKAMGVEGSGFLRKTQFRPFGQKLTKKIKDKSIRRQIEDELVNLIDEIIQ